MRRAQVYRIFFRSSADVTWNIGRHECTWDVHEHVLQYSAENDWSYTVDL